MSVGNLKADAPPPPVDKAAQKLIAAGDRRAPGLARGKHASRRRRHGGGRASRDEEAREPNLLTIIVPRHPDRGPLIVKQLSGAGLNVALRSEGKLPDAAPTSISPTRSARSGCSIPRRRSPLSAARWWRGGQNPVEPIKLGAAVLTGPNFQNFADAL